MSLALERRRLAEHAAEPHLAGQLRLRRVADVVLPDIAVQPVREVQEAVVHRHEEVGDQARHRELAALRPRRPATSITLSAFQPCLVLVPVPHRCCDSAAPTKPCGLSGSWWNRTSSGIMPGPPRSKVWAILRSFQSQK